MLERNNTISSKMQEVDNIIYKIESGETPLEETLELYKDAIKKVEQLKNDLTKLENEIEILSKDFTQETEL